MADIALALARADRTADWLAGTASHWLALAGGGSGDEPGADDRVTREPTRSVRSGARPALFGRVAPHRGGGSGAGGGQRGLADDIRAVVERALWLANELSTIAREAGISDRDPLSITPRAPWSPRRAMKGKR